MRNIITQKELRKLLHYNAKCGTWTWRSGNYRNPHWGMPAGTRDPAGYNKVWVKGQQYFASRLAWLYIKGYWPENEIDHINRNPSDDRWKNLREISRQCNMRNCGVYITNTSGITGVSWKTARNCWRSYIMVNREQKHLGCFDDLTEAVAHRFAAEQCLDWSDCDLSSPALQYMKNYLKEIRT